MDRTDLLLGPEALFPWDQISGVWEIPNGPVLLPLSPLEHRRGYTQRLAEYGARGMKLAGLRTA